MSDVIERIKKRIEDVQSKLDRSVFCYYDNTKYDGYECALIIIDEELAKEQPEEPNIPIQCVDGSCPIALSEEYEERGMDVIHSCAECQYQPQVQPIVRNVEEIAAMLWRLDYYMRKQSKQDWIDWLTKKEV